MRARRERGESPARPGTARDTGTGAGTRDTGPCPAAAPRGPEPPPIAGVARAGPVGRGAERGSRARWCSPRPASCSAGDGAGRAASLTPGSQLLEPSRSGPSAQNSAEFPQEALGSWKYGSWTGYGGEEGFASAFWKRSPGEADGSFQCWLWDSVVILLLP